jgi:hypothetical protein
MGMCYAKELCWALLSAYMTYIYTAPIHRRRGLARHLMKTILEWSEISQLDRMANPSMKLSSTRQSSTMNVPTRVAVHKICCKTSKCGPEYALSQYIAQPPKTKARAIRCGQLPLAMLISISSCNSAYRQYVRQERG